MNGGLRSAASLEGKRNHIFIYILGYYLAFRDPARTMYVSQGTFKLGGRRPSISCCMTALLLAFDDARYATRCEATIAQLRERGNYSGPIEVVGPPGVRFSRGYGVQMRTLAEVLRAGGNTH